jgi:hypothetical protein
MFQQNHPLALNLLGAVTRRHRHRWKITSQRTRQKKEKRRFSASESYYKDQENYGIGHTLNSVVWRSVATSKDRTVTDHAGLCCRRFRAR